MFSIFQEQQDVECYRLNRPRSPFNRDPLIGPQLTCQRNGAPGLVMGAGHYSGMTLVHAL